MPLIAVSPFFKPRYVSHTVADHTSLLALIEKRFLRTGRDSDDVAHLTLRDAHASTLEDLFDFDRSPSLNTPVTNVGDCLRTTARPLEGFGRVAKASLLQSSARKRAALRGGKGESRPQRLSSRAAEGIRTLDPELGKLVLYQLSYHRKVSRRHSNSIAPVKGPAQAPLSVRLFDGELVAVLEVGLTVF